MGYLELAKSFLRKQSNFQESTPASCVELVNPVLIAQTLGGSEKNERNEESRRTRPETVSAAFGSREVAVCRLVSDESPKIGARAGGNGAATGTRAASVAWETPGGTVALQSPRTDVGEVDAHYPDESCTVASDFGTLSAGRPCPTYGFWDGEKLSSSADEAIAFDTETELIEDERVIPRLALAAVSDGNQHLLIHPDRLGDFLDAHCDEHFVGHNIQFDFWVVDQHFREAGHPALRVLWDACDQGRLHDTMILDMLIQLATSKYRKVLRSGSRDETKVYPGKLSDLAADYTTWSLDKDDMHRERFGELVGVPIEKLREADPGFFGYAILDVAATYHLYPALTKAALELMTDCGFGKSSERYEIRPDAIQKFGYLSEVIQTKASIVLAHMFRRGVSTDLAGVRALAERNKARVEELTRELQHSYPNALAYGKDGQVQLTPKSRTPSLGRKRLATILQSVAEEIQGNGQPVQIPISEGKSKGISQSTKSWQKLVPRHRFLQIWTEMKRLEKLQGLVTMLDAPTLHCQYSLLTRTGRTACSKPRNAAIPGVNLQQMPKQAEYRELFIPRSPGHQLFIADYSAIELRTLAAVCRAKFGQSRLADVLDQGGDPHVFTAAAIQNMPLEHFMALKQMDPVRFRQGRQAAKAINFGVPGGLGANALRAYAEANYAVALTEAEASAFRSKLISEIYPELNDVNGYLADPAMANLARNLRVPEDNLWDTFDRSKKRSSIAARGVSNVIAGRSQASLGYQQRVWRGLCRLLRLHGDVDRGVLEAIMSGAGSPALHDRLYHQKVATLTGRVRDGVRFTDSKNTPFQSLAADGAKLALWNLLYAGFDVYGFVHDEILIDLPVEASESEGREIRDIMVRSMEEVLEGIPADCAWKICPRWAKPD